MRSKSVTWPLAFRCQDLNLLTSMGTFSSFYPSPVPMEGEDLPPTRPGLPKVLSWQNDAE